MAIKCTKIFYCKTLQNLPKIGNFGLKIYHLATLVVSTSRRSFLLSGYSIFWVYFEKNVCTHLLVVGIMVTRLAEFSPNG
jgi:hypothetical protein